MALRLAGKPVAEKLREELKTSITGLKRQGIFPKLRILRVGKREDDIAYERGILRGCQLLEIACEVQELAADVTQAQLLEAIRLANGDALVHGILLFRPLPGHLCEEEVARTLSPQKDIDCMSPANLQKVFEGGSQGFAPCTPKAVVELLKFYDIPLEGASIAVAGRSLVVGKPLAMLLLDENATVTLCHSRTKDLRKVTSQADIVVAAVGKARLMDHSYFGPHSIVVDVGINDDGAGSICGDVDYDDAFAQVAALSPAIGGVGTITTTLLLRHVVQAAISAAK